MRRIPWVALVLCLMLAFALRVHLLDSQSLWSDEGLSVYRARQSLLDIPANIITVDGVDTRDTNPPLYFLILHTWRAVAGESVFALRYVGVVAGVLAISLAYLFGKRLINRLIGLGAALLLAISPFHIWQCQEMRNYSLLLFFNLLSVYGLSRFLLGTSEKARWRWLALWGAAGLAGVYTHYFGFFVLAFGVGLLVLFHLRLWRLWVVLGILALGLFPVGLAAATRFLEGPQVDFVMVPVHHLLSHAASAYSVGVIQTVVQPLWRVLPVVVLAAAGLWLSVRQEKRAAGLLLAYQVAPLGILVLLSSINPLYNGTRHLLIGLPPFLVLVAAGVVLQRSRLRWVAGLVGLGVVVSQVAWLWVQYSSPDLVKDDVRGAAAYLNVAARPDDVIVLHDALIGFAFDYYYDGAAPWISVPRYGEVAVEPAIDTLERVASETSGRVWFLAEPTPRSGFPRWALSDWVSEHWPSVFKRRFPSLWLGVELDCYLPHPAVPGLPASAASAEVAWDDALVLRGYDIPPTVRLGEPWWLTTFWSTQSADLRRYTLSLRLVDPEGRPWAQIDQPLWVLYPPEQWSVAQVVRFEQEVEPPLGLPPGEYQLWLRVLESDGGQPLLTTSGEEAYLLASCVQVISAVKQVAGLVAPTWDPLQVHFGGGIDLVGYRLPAGENRPGYPVPLELLWFVRHSPPADYRLLLELVDEGGQVVAKSVTSPTRADYPTSQWHPGQYLMGRAGVLVPPQTSAGPLIARVSLLDTDSGSERAVPIGGLLGLVGKRSQELGTIEVTEWPMVTDMLPVQRPFQATFGDPVLAELHGYDIEQEGGKLVLTLYWRVGSSTKTGYIVFVHFAGVDETIYGQGDGVPVGGIRPTTTWRPGEVIVDTHVISISPETPAGEYALWVGFYDLARDVRLPASRDGAAQPADRVLLETIRVAP